MLALDHFAQPLHGIHHLLALRIGVRLPHLQSLHHVRKLIQHPLSHLARTGLGQLLDIAEHFFQVLVGHGLIGPKPLRHLGKVSVLLGLFSHGLQEAVQRISQLVDQFGNFLLGCAIFKRLA